MTRDLKRIQLRRTVTRRLDHFFTAWLEHLATGSTRIWSRVEDGLHTRKGAQATPDMQTSPPLRTPMQQQPLQQQQQKKEEEK